MNAFSNIYDTLPLLDIGNKIGYTDYIDFIRAEDMNHPIMKGIDIFGRKFIAIKVKTRNTQTNEFKEIVGTFFQRYSNTNQYAFGTVYDLNIIHHDSRVREYQSENLEKRLKLLLDGQTIKNIDTFTDDTDYILGNGYINVWMDCPCISCRKP
jgi:hypothetical protein